MATIVREQSPVVERTEREVVREGDNGIGWIVGLIVLVLLVAAFFVYALPALRNSSSGSNRSATLNVNVNKDAGANESNTQ